MAVAVYTESKLAEEIWLMKTGGATESEPTLGEVQRRVDHAAGFRVKTDLYDKMKLDNQHEIGGNYILKFAAIALVTNDTVSKKCTLPTGILDLGRDKGLYLITYGVPEKRVMITTAKAMIGASNLRSFASPYYGVWQGPELIVYDRCIGIKPRISEVNVYAAIANETTLPEAMNYLIMQDVLKYFAEPTIPDQINDQNNTR